MYLVAIAWIYVALMMAIAEAIHSEGSMLGAIVTFLFYGVGPLALVLYIMATPSRRARIRAHPIEGVPTSSMDEATSSSVQPDKGSHSP